MYDYLRRLSAASTTGSTSYQHWSLSETYDRYGNLSTQSGTTNVPPITLTIDQTTNRISPTTGYGYDNSGNLTSTPNPGGTSYHYDGEECLATYGSAGSNATYTCDGNGVRVSKVVTGAGAVTTVLIYSGSRVVAEYDNGAAATSPTREYVYGKNLIATVTGSTGGSGGTIVYQHRDHLSPRLYTNSSGSDVGEQGTFPFGELWYQSGTTSNWVFTTYERDPESGNDNALARSYANSQARFLSPDPERGDPSNPQSWNRYAYVGNDPINVTDSTGKNWLFDLLGGLIGLLAADPALDGLLFGWGLGSDGVYWADFVFIAPASSTPLGAQIAADTVSAISGSSFGGGSSAPPGPHGDWFHGYVQQYPNDVFLPPDQDFIHAPFSCATCRPPDFYQVSGSVGPYGETFSWVPNRGMVWSPTFGPSVGPPVQLNGTANWMLNGGANGADTAYNYVQKWGGQASGFYGAGGTYGCNSSGCAVGLGGGSPGASLTGSWGFEMSWEEPFPENGEMEQMLQEPIGDGLYWTKETPWDP